MVETTEEQSRKLDAAAGELAATIKARAEKYGVWLYDRADGRPIFQKYGLARPSGAGLMRRVKVILGHDLRQVWLDCLDAVLAYVDVIRTGERPEDIQAWRDLYAQKGAKYKIWMTSARNLLSKTPYDQPLGGFRHGKSDTGESEPSDARLDGFSEVRAALTQLEKMMSKEQALLDQKAEIDSELEKLREQMKSLRDVKQAYEVLRSRAIAAKSPVKP